MESNVSPNHYKGEVECISAIKSAMSKEAFKGYLRGNVIKYVWRFDKKNGIEDLKKAQVYLNWLIDETNTTISERKGL